LVGRLTEATDAYLALPHRRMVIIGEPGSGKSVFAMVMALQLTARRQSGDAVPVIFPVGSWNVSMMSLQGWLCEYLTENYHLGGYAESDIRRTARALVEGGLVLPILDGLDEMPESVRPQAIDEINRSLEADHAVILTSRATEYR
jgi:predicted NACHT family NTPase